MVVAGNFSTTYKEWSFACPDVIKLQVDSRSVSGCW